MTGEITWLLPFTERSLKRQDAKVAGGEEKERWVVDGARARTIKLVRGANGGTKGRVERIEVSWKRDRSILVKSNEITDPFVPGIKGTIV